MATSIGCRHVGGERIADGIGEFRCRYWCMYFIVRDPIRINRAKTFKMDIATLEEALSRRQWRKNGLK